MKASIVPMGILTASSTATTIPAVTSGGAFTTSGRGRLVGRSVGLDVDDAVVGDFVGVWVTEDFVGVSVIGDFVGTLLGLSVSPAVG